MLPYTAVKSTMYSCCSTLIYIIDMFGIEQHPVHTHAERGGKIIICVSWHFVCYELYTCMCE